MFRIVLPSARLAVLHAKGRIAVGEPYVSRSILGTEFHASVVRETNVAGRPGRPDG